MSKPVLLRPLKAAPTLALALALASAAILLPGALGAQTLFDETIEMPADFTPLEVVMPPSPLTTQVLYVGGVDIVQAPATYGNPQGPAVGKEWNDFIGITPDTTGESLGWVSINHEMIYHSDLLGDGGGMTVFRVKRAADGTLETMEQTLEDGRTGEFFGVDFVNTVGETGMNCGGIVSGVDGRIWSAEEWFRTSNASINSGDFSDAFEPDAAYPKAPGSPTNQGVRDTADWTVSSDIPGWDGVTLEKYQNFNYMVEIDPRQAKAIRKQYNWGRQPFEGGAVEPSNKVIYLGPDNTPGFFGKFVAETPGDFTTGTLFAYKHDAEGYNWVPIYGQEDLLNHTDAASRKGATMFDRIEWVTIDPATTNVYFTETGRDKPGRGFAYGESLGGVHDPYHLAEAAKQGVDSPTSDDYTDYYGRIWKYDPVLDTATVLLAGGPGSMDPSAAYPEKFLSNPDGLVLMHIDGKPFLVIQEDLNGGSQGRVPDGVSNRTCEVYLLDLAIENPTIDDLIRLTAVPAGAEVTGGQPTPDGKSLLLNVQHPRATNPFPYNHSLTFAIHGFDKVRYADMSDEDAAPEARLLAPARTAQDETFSVFPNPTTRSVSFNKTQDVAVYDAATGQRVLVRQGADRLDVSNLSAGIYLIQNAEGETLRLVVE